MTPGEVYATATLAVSAVALLLSLAVAVIAFRRAKP